MNKRKLITMTAIAVAVVGLSATGVALTHAASNSTTTNPISSLVTAIAQKFNLNVADVQQVFDQQHQQMEAQAKTNYTAGLQQAVTEGKLTQDQMDKLLAKQQELESKREANKSTFQNLTETERRQKMQDEQTALQQWATQNNIPMQYLHFGFGGRHGHHGGHRFGPDMNSQGTNQNTTQSTQTNN